MGMGLGMGMNRWEWEGMGMLQAIPFPHISNFDILNRLRVTHKCERQKDR